MASNIDLLYKRLLKSYFQADLYLKFSCIVWGIIISLIIIVLGIAITGDIDFLGPIIILCCVPLMFLLVSGLEMAPNIRPPFITWYDHQLFLFFGEGPVRVFFRQMWYRFVFELFVFFICMVCGSARSAYRLVEQSAQNTQNTKNQIAEQAPSEAPEGPTPKVFMASSSAEKLRRGMSDQHKPLS